ncbi:MAG: DUF4249 domain-containing protein [Leadbetterella sp.]|nr:DUF4249 domain-containing protein [Leadbetterella sp.]
MKPVKLIYLLITGLLFSCEEPYTPVYEPGDSAPILIIEGYIDMSGNSRFRLSQTVPLSSEESSVPVSTATLTIESENNTSHPLTASSATGEYTLPHPALSMDTRYRLRVKAMGKEYLSGWVTPLATSGISGLEFERTDTGMEFFVSTVNQNSNSRYYRWEFEETWKFSAKHISYLIFDGSQVRLRLPEENISMCFNQDRSSEILIATSESLSDNTIERQKIGFIPNLSEKLMYRYSLLVKQYSISKEAYLFWSILKKNSESVGDIFGSMPSELKGNVTNVADPAEPVIAMIEASLPSRKRVYYNSTEIRPPWPVYEPFYDGCRSDTVRVGDDAVALFRSSVSYVPTYEIFMNEAIPYPTHYAYTTSRCTECALRGFLNAPDFWTEND